MVRFRWECCVLCCVVLAGRATGQQDFSDVRIEVTPVAGNVYMLEGRGGNIGASVGADGILIVDDQFAALAEKIRTALKKLNPGELQFVLNTHWHSDHTGGNRVFGTEATIIAHTNVRGRLSMPQTVRGKAVEPSPIEALPVITFDESLSIHFNGEEIRVIHFPHGHTDGDSVVFFMGSNVVHMGDTFFAGRFPFVDLSSGGDVEGLTRNIQTVIDRLGADAKIIPGHGPLSTLADLKAYCAMLKETTAIVRKRIDEGMTLEQVQAAGLDAKWEKWGAGFITTEQWLETVYKSLTSKTK